MSRELKATVACLALGGALLGGCDVLDSDEDDATPEAARGTYTFSSSGAGFTLGSGGGVTFGSGGGVTTGSAGGGAPAAASGPDSLGAGDPDAVAPAAEVPPTTGPVEPEEEERTPTPPAGPAGEVPGPVEGEHWSAALLRASWRFTESPFHGYFQYRPTEGTAPVNLYRIALNEDDGQIWHTWFKDEALDDDGSGENCFRLVSRSVLVEVADGVMRQIDDVGETEDVTEFTLEDYGILYSYYRNTDGNPFVADERVPTFEGLAANDLATCSPPAPEPES